MKSSNLLTTHKNLTQILKTYILSIVKEYGAYIPQEHINLLNAIDDFDNIIRIFDFGSINGYADHENIYMPLSAEVVLKKMSKIPGFGLKKNHQTYTTKNLILNNNTYLNYVWHIFISGSTIENYYEELLLHEAMHFCGSGGATALKEGINELLTRKLALEKGFKTSGCGYPKEVQIAYELQTLLGEEIINQIAFINNEAEIFKYLELELGYDAAELYTKVSWQMEEEFNNKYYKHMENYNGFSGILKKTINYFKLDYNQAHKTIYEYSIKKEVKTSIK